MATEPLIEGVAGNAARRPARPLTISGVEGHKVPRLALSKAEAAESLGVSVDFLEEHVMPELRIVRRGRRRLIAVAELERWLSRSAALTLGDER
jgi:excisionase family DNA binding protein